ncbi:MAG: phosphoribosyltransferase family protein, partial [Chlamydiota bacterium]
VIPFPELEGKTVILVDDGIATGATMLVGIRSMRKKQVSRIVVATPVAAKDIWQSIILSVDEAICLHVAEYFLGISSFYSDFSEVDDETVKTLLLSSDNLLK